MSADAYLARAAAAIARVADEQREPIAAAAHLMVDAITHGHTLWAFGASHSFMLAEEMVYRTGGLMLVNPIYPHGMNLFVRPATATSQMERVLGLGSAILRATSAAAGDVLILASTSGRNAVAIDMALAAHEMSLRTIGITSMAYTQGVTSRHPSGKKVCDLCDVVIDNAAPYGDACVEITGFADRVGPLSSVTGCAIVNALASEVAARMAAAGLTPPVFMSANLDGGDAHNAHLLEANRARIHYME